MSVPSILPDVPVKHSDFISYLQSNPGKLLSQLLEPYNQYDAKLREVFVQEPNHPSLNDPYLNLVPTFRGRQKDLRIRARNFEAESIEEKEKYVLKLDNAERRPNASPAIVGDLKDFQKNFALFSETSLVDLDWSHVVAAGSAVVTCLLPVPSKHNRSKKTLRNYYHDIIAPASDVDLFIYGLNEEEAIQKIIQIEKRSILTETTTIRTKNAITIASRYPTRHVQIVLRLYKSVSEILTGFDVDCSCAAYDGKEVWTSPRALTAYMTQINTIDLTRRSPSYENRLFKYSRRGFEVYWSLLERSKIDPTIYERNFAKTVGLARLLVLERLPTKSEREAYMDQRRVERGQFVITRYPDDGTDGNLKNNHEDEVAEWVDPEDVSGYHTFTIPYGAQFDAKKIEKLLYKKDLLLNSERNKRHDRKVNLHRHPAFFGHAEDVIKDCCGFCPKPVTPEEHDVAKEEAKIYVSEEISFIKDDAGRQAIGSLHPITDDDWTEMAYVSNTAQLCQAIIDEDLEHVEDWLDQEGSDANCRDYTGRTPLHLAVTSSSPKVVKALIEKGARLVARLADGRTALHLASARGNVEMVEMIMQKSQFNKEEEAKKEDIRKQALIAARKEKSDMMNVDENLSADDAEKSDIEMITTDDSDDDIHSRMTGSYIKIKQPETKTEELDGEEDEPDVHDVNLLTWNTESSPLHLAILNGHTNVVRLLVQKFGADPLLPIKFRNDHTISTLVLALQLPLQKAKAMTQALLEIGASSAQADTSQKTALHFISEQQPEVLETLFQFDEPAVKRAINHLSVSGSAGRPRAKSPLISAISTRNSLAALKLLEAGANPTIKFEQWMESIDSQFQSMAGRNSKQNHFLFETTLEQPITLTVEHELPQIALELLARGANPNCISTKVFADFEKKWRSGIDKMESLLEIVQKKIKVLRAFEDAEPPTVNTKLKEGVDYLEGIEPGSYKHFVAQMQLDKAHYSDQRKIKTYEDKLKRFDEREGVAQKKQAVEALAEEFETFEQELLKRGAKTFKELYPDVICGDVVWNSGENRHYRYSTYQDLPWKVTFHYGGRFLEDQTREAYHQLFQAAWDGDFATITSLTMATWGPSNKQKPLEIAVTDGNDQSPFSLAILRGHFEVARGIIEISYAQFSLDDKKEKARYHLGNREDVEAAMSVKSTTSPLTYLTRNCTSLWKYAKFYATNKKFTYGMDNQEIEEGEPWYDFFSWAIITDNKPLFSLISDLKVEWTDRLAKYSDGSARFPTFPQKTFELAIQYNRLDILAEMIKQGGAGMELEPFVRKSGVKYKAKTEFYQGLSVHGKKMAKWVSAARIRDTHPPLLQAAFNGNLASLEFFMSDTPVRHYRDFAEAYKHNKLITHLNEAAGGFDKKLMKWIGARRDLALHCAVMAEPKPETLKLIQYLIERMPGSLELKSKQGHTPLALAFSLGRIEAIKLLTAAGADQKTRDLVGNNILHLILCPAYGSFRAVKTTIKNSLHLIDKRLISSLLSERSSHALCSQTPFARWLSVGRNYVDDIDDDDWEVLHILLELGSPTDNDHLELLDDSDETPLHHAVESNDLAAVEMILKYRPDLLHRENSVGRTPYDVANDVYIESAVSLKPYTPADSKYYTIIEPPQIFSKTDQQDREFGGVDPVWRFCERFAAEHPEKRRLVSLLDVNEVAERLAKRQTERQANWQSRGADDDNTEDSMDEVAQWYGSAPANESNRLGQFRRLEALERERSW